MTQNGQMVQTLPMRTVPEALAWLRAKGAKQIQIDSRLVQPGDAFLAWPGAAQDGRAFVGQALALGAVACLVEAQTAEINAKSSKDPSPQNHLSADKSTAAVATMAHLKAASGELAAAWYGHPSKNMAMIAVTGTNGKTSTTWWLAQALTRLPAPWGRVCGVMGTLGNGVVEAEGLVNEWQPTGLTTPDPITVQRTLRAWVDQGVTACALEASSIGLSEHRLAGCDIRVAIFTNFTQDHLDYHGDMAAYWEAKRSLFEAPGLQAAVVNLDDAKGLALSQSLAQNAARKIDIWTISAEAPKPQIGGVDAARLRAEAIAYRDGGLRFEVVEIDPAEGLERARVSLKTQLIGRYNVCNLLGVLAALRALGVPLEKAANALSGLTPVPGRMQCIETGLQSPIPRPYVVVDYAHTPDALTHALAALREVAQTRGGQLGCVFGCGGDRDASKRPLMGASANAGADWVFVTNDNPRSENPEAIAQAILQGVLNPERVATGKPPAFDVVLNRAQAIDQAIAKAQPNDVVLLAGMGHETSQDIGGVKTPFSDVQQARRALAAHWGFFSLQEVAKVLGAEPPKWGGEQRPVRVHTDTRSLQPGDLFVALRGERFDAHDYLAQARAAGAIGAVVVGKALAQPHPQALQGWPLIEVDDTLQALGHLAGAWRDRFTGPVLAVTGSNGKTTVTQMLASVLQAHWPHASLATQGNFNNEIGLPLTLLRLRAEHQAAVVELGMNHPGEIARLAAITKPTVAMVNNAQREHQEFMGTVEAVALENGQVFQHLQNQGVAVFPADEPYADLWLNLATNHGPQVLRFSATPGVEAEVNLLQAEWRGTRWQVSVATPHGELVFCLALAGRHNVRNALAVIAGALAAGVPLTDIVKGLESFRAVSGRSRVLTLSRAPEPLTVVDDTYNANPDSVRAAIQMLAGLPAPRLLVLGDMGEVGDQGPAFHTEAGVEAKAAGIDHLFTLGALSQASAKAFTGARHFEDIDALNQAVNNELPQLGSMLVKGSRFMKMERVIASLPEMVAPTPSTSPRQKNSKEGLTCS